MAGFATTTSAAMTSASHSGRPSELRKHQHLCLVMGRVVRIQRGNPILSLARSPCRMRARRERAPVNRIAIDRVYRTPRRTPSCSTCCHSATPQAPDCRDCPASSSATCATDRPTVNDLRTASHSIASTDVRSSRYTMDKDQRPGLRWQSAACWPQGGGVGRQPMWYGSCRRALPERPPLSGGRSRMLVELA